jgi:hypothetical protein
MHDLYLYYASHPNGEWNSNGGAFTVADFAAWILMIECAGDTDCLKYSMQAWSRQLWGTRIDAQGNATPTPYCPSSPCTNGVFNFLGVYSGSAMGRYNDLIAKDYDALEQSPTNYYKYGAAGYTVQSVGNDIVTNPKWTDFNNDVPVHMGSFSRPSWVTNMCPDTPMFTNARDGIVYKFAGDNGAIVAVYTINQEIYWSSHRSGMCAK